ncbi:MAG: TauD/TfdA family dioxygenase, partial [Rhodothermaceae bacterium]|nr:TauD/TfdA family dioxygenase [Rhodothermaceae bacterium]
MQKTNLVVREALADQLQKDGYIMLHDWHSEEKTISIARSLGSVVDIRTLLPESDISAVQALRPGYNTESFSNTYTGTYGLAEFPMHTDFAHWARPPRYLMLRCKKGAPGVTTTVLPYSQLNSILEMSTLRRALLKPRRTRPDNTVLLLPLVFRSRGVNGFRWDSLFLVPMNEAANKVSDILSHESLPLSWFKPEIKSVVLARTGDTLIIDNWR